MGYETNVAPPRPWFCGHVYLKHAKELMEGIPNDSEKIQDLTKIVAARLNIMRGIRVALRLPPEDYRANDAFLEGLDGRVAIERLEELKGFLLCDFRYSIDGTGQYGVPNYSIRDKKYPEARFSVLAEEGKKLLGQLTSERIKALNGLMAVAMEIFFWDVYVPEKQDDIHYYDLREYMSESEIVEKIVEFGLANDEEEVWSRWGKSIANGGFNIDNGGEVDQAFHAYNEETFHCIVNDDFWGWDETEAIYHGFGD